MWAQAGGHGGMALDIQVRVPRAALWAEPRWLEGGGCGTDLLKPGVHVLCPLCVYT